MGESELVLDGMTVEEAMRLLGGGGRSKRARRARASATDAKQRSRPSARRHVADERAARLDEPRVSPRADR